MTFSFTVTVARGRGALVFQESDGRAPRALHDLAFPVPRTYLAIKLSLLFT
jgi:hypothetical protein